MLITVFAMVVHFQVVYPSNIQFYFSNPSDSFTNYNLMVAPIVIVMTWTSLGSEDVLMTAHFDV